MRPWIRRLWPAFVVPVIVAATVGSDFLGLPGFWRDHAITAGLVSGLALLLITVAVVEALIEQRDARRWQTAALLGFKTFAGSVGTALDDLSFALTGCRPRFLTYEPPWDETWSRRLTPTVIAGRVDAELLAAVLGDPQRRRWVEEALVALRLRHRESLAVWLPTFVTVGRLAATAERLATFNQRLGDLQHPFVEARALDVADAARLDALVADCSARIAAAVDEGLRLQRDLMDAASATWWRPEERHLHVFGRPAPDPAG